MLETRVRSGAPVGSGVGAAKSVRSIAAALLIALTLASSVLVLDTAINSAPAAAATNRKCPSDTSNFTGECVQSFLVASTKEFREIRLWPSRLTCFEIRTDHFFQRNVLFFRGKIVAASGFRHSAQDTWSRVDCRLVA